MKTVFIAVIVALSGVMSGLQAAESIATLRGSTPLTEQGKAPDIPKMVNEGLRRKRNYPEQPPSIPHSIRDYQVDLNVNKCLTCHARKYTEESQAPMVSITHYMDRDGQFLASISPRRYFCNQCHVVELNVKPLIGNDFVDIDTVLSSQ